MVRPTPQERFDAKVDRNGPVARNHPELGRCHVWTAGLFDQGYGQFWADGRPQHAHRWLWEQERGPIPRPLVLDHFACDRRACVNLDHCRPSTVRENVLRENTGRGPGSKSRQTRCAHGHRMTEVNTYRFGPEKRWRSCRACRRRLDRESKRRTRR